MTEFVHVPVLLNECLDGLAIRPDGTYLDCTLGGGGHSSEILKKLNAGRLIGIDRDPDAIRAASARLSAVGGNFTALPVNFHDAKSALEEIGVTGVDGILADLGVSSYQLDTPERGFSYHEDAPLDMRMDTRGGQTAADLVNNLPEAELTRIIRDYGEENWAKKIAQVICDRRKKAPILTTLQLVDVIDAAIPAKIRRNGDGHPARRTFQALRIAVNDELAPLERALEDLASMLNPGGRLCVIAFHSLEDRIVKNTFRRLADPCECPKNFPVCVCGKKPTVKQITRKPVTAGPEELERNPRSRSATLRIIEKLEVE